MDLLRNAFGYRPRLKVHMFKGDSERMKELVLRHPAKETGGNLFGLWTDNGEPVLHIVLGPAIGCTRTEVSFYQSIPYLERVGGVLTQQYQLCHIGEWHSHHRLRLSEPSSGDSSTVIRNFPRGTCGFLLIIANIQLFGDVTLSPYLYREGQRSYEKCEINELDGQSPFFKIDPIYSHMLQGEDTSTTVNEHRQKEDIRPRNYPESPPVAKDEDNNAHVYMFQEDSKMIEGFLRESGEIGHEGDLFGLWTTDQEPVLHVVHRPSKPKKEPSNGQPQEAKENGGKSLSKEYPSLQKIGKYILHSPLQHDMTPEEKSNFRHEFPHGGVCVVAYTVASCQDERQDVGLSSYIYSNSNDPHHWQQLESKFLPGSKVFRQVQKTNDKIEDKEPMDTDPPSPNFEQHLSPNVWV